jgi:hypothetical protein
MAEQFQPGDMVERAPGAKASYPRSYPKCSCKGPKVGRIYTVYAVNSYLGGLVVGLSLNELPLPANHGHSPDVDAEMMRLVYRPSADLIAKLTAEPVLPEAPKVKRRVSA